MILGVIIGGRHYALKKYLFIFIIVLGVALFMYNPNKAGKTSQADSPLNDAYSFIGVGELMLVTENLRIILLKF